MDIQNNNGKQIQVDLPMNITQEPYVFANGFDPNMCSAAQYSPPQNQSNTGQTAVIAPFHALTSNHTELSNADISLISTTDGANNGITYSNVIFVPTIASNGNQLDQIGVELVPKHEDVSAVEGNDGHSYKYVLSSEPRFINTFIRSNEIDNATTIINNTEAAFIEQPSHMITTVSQINENNLIINGIPNQSTQIEQQNVEQIDQNQIAVQMHTTNDQEVLMQDENGQLYRQVQNIFVNGTSMCPTELLPLMSAPPVDLGDPDYVEQSMNRIQNTFQQRDLIAHDTFPVNFITNSDVADTIPTSKAIDTNLDMQQVDFIFNTYRNSSNHIDGSQFGDETESNILNDKTEFQPEPSMNSSNESTNQQRALLESTMSTLLAAVNDITAREEQFQQYLTSKSAPDGDMNFYSTTRDGSMTPSIYNTHPTTKISSECPKDVSKDLNLGANLSHEVFPNSCDSPGMDEFVDINEMEVIKERNDEGVREKSVLMRRSRRKKTTKRKDDQLLVVDKFVPSRALATLPTSYLFFETVNSVGPSRTKQIVFAKREIPLEMKFGPFVGDTKTLNKHEIKLYRESKMEFPFLFLSHNSILDVSNENASNWMCFVRLAKKHDEQNLQLCVINSHLYFKCCKCIEPKQELRVGYSKEYAQKYHLNYLSPEKLNKLIEYVCTKCDQRFTSNDSLQSHLDKHKTKNEKPVQSVPRVTPTKIDSNSPNKSKDRLNTGAIRMRKLALSKTSRTSGPTVRYACCYCSKVFSKFLSYKKHTNIVHSVNIEHKRVKVDAQHKRLTIEDSVLKIAEPMNKNESRNVDANQWFVCQTCQQHFMTAEKLEKHQLSNCNDKEATIVQCHICLKQLQTPSALTMHIKTHDSANGIIKCPFCVQSYQNTIIFKDHVRSHMIDGTFKCPHCAKEFPKYSSIRKHIRINHSAVRFVCHECGKDFKSKYKLKEHSLSHSDVREFSCAHCDKQFKRKDKLREHILRIHAKTNTLSKNNKSKTLIQKEILKSPEERCSSVEELNEESNEESIIERECLIYPDSKTIEPHEFSGTQEDDKASGKPKFQPKVPPTDYERFIYKCEHCMLGFKRRGMLVNHMAKRHPDIPIDSIHELNLPILKTERCFYCQYCEKVYKSSSKRKAHILKYHPGQKLPMSTRYKTENYENCMETNSTFSANVGSITMHAHQCMWCYKQYASRSRLLQHKRKEHSKEIEESYKKNQNDYFKDLNVIMDSHEGHFPPQMQMNQSNIDEYSIKFNDEMHEHESHSVHRFHQIDYEPENRLLELSSAALETFRDDYSFLSDSDAHTGTIEHTNMNESRVDVNFKMVGDEFDGQENSNCDLNSLPLFEEIDCMSLKAPSQFTSNSSTQMDSSIEKLSYNK